MYKLTIFLIRGYQLLISSWLPPRCRFTISCSQYALLAVHKYGTIKGIWLALKRIGRCHPWSKCDIHDPLP